MFLPAILFLKFCATFVQLALENHRKSSIFIASHEDSFEANATKFERSTQAHNLKVIGSIPIPATIFVQLL